MLRDASHGGNQRAATDGTVSIEQLIRTAPCSLSPSLIDTHDACCLLRVALLVLRFLQVVTANAVFKRWYKGAQVSNSFRASDAIRALAVHATRRIEPFEEILAHYGQRYVRLDETGHEYKPGLPARDLPVNMCQKPADLLGSFLPADAYSA